MRVIRTTAIVQNKICLVVVVGGKEVANPFVVTEVCINATRKIIDEAKRVRSDGGSSKSPPDKQ